jgi:teichuronic acid biosynthesis glycosyltransferase TuaC
MKILVVTEYYPRAAEPVLGIWAHRQALAARAAGAEVRVLVLHRPLPPLAAVRHADGRAIRAHLAQPSSANLDGLRVDYVRYLSPPRPWSYASWGAWAAPALRRALRRIGEHFPFDLVHAHYAVPAGDAVRRAAPHAPVVVSVHGGDVHGAHALSPNVGLTLRHAGLVLANSAGTARRVIALGATAVRVVHLGTDLGAGSPPPAAVPTLVTVGNLIDRKRHADVIAALPSLHKRHPGLRYVIVGEGPERERLRELAARLGVAAHVELRGALGHAEAVATAQAATLFVLPSMAEAFGVSYVEAMAGGVPAIGCRGEDGPEEIAAGGGGIELVTPRDPQGLAAVLEALLSDPERRAALGRAARENVAHNFTWERCGRDTLDAYRDVLAATSDAGRTPADRF